jgi:hypothetical protein
MLYILQSFGNSYLGDLLLIFICAMIFVAAVRGLARKPISATHDHQHRRFVSFIFSARTFYETVAKAVASKGYPEVKIGPAHFPEGSVIAGNREYLRLERGHVAVDLCAVQFGSDYFISWWMGEIPDGFRALIAGIPFIGKALDSFLYRRTQYQVDAEIMFKASVNDIIEEAIAGISEVKGIRAIKPLGQVRVESPEQQPADEQKRD